MPETVRNVLFIIADQWRGDTLGAVGHPAVKTPHLDALAGDGVLFANHYSQASPCGPSRASILTGRYMHNHRQVGNGTPLDARFTNLALEVGKAGYEAALFGYTDTPLDPGGAAAGGGERRDWICPGFTPVAPFLFANGLAEWMAHLQSKGYDLPERPIDMFRPTPDSAPPAGRIDAFPPSRVRSEDSDTAFLTDAALRYITENGAGPWFVHYCCLRPHPPLYAPAPYDTLYEPATLPLPDRPASPDDMREQHPWLAWAIDDQGLREYFHRSLTAGEIRAEDDRRMRAAYYGNCSEVDANIGRLIAHLKESGAYDDTLILFCSDHGDQLGDNWLYGRRGCFAGHFHVPCIIRDPRRAADATRGHTVAAFTESVDLMPTILEALGLETPSECDGHSLIPFLHDAPPAAWRDAAHWAFDFRDPVGRTAEDALGLSSADCHLTAIRDTRYQYVHFAAMPPMFFDLAADPVASRNLADDPAYASLVLRYAQKMLTWRLRHEDPGLTMLHQPYGGPLQPAPAG